MRIVIANETGEIEIHVDDHNVSVDVMTWDHASSVVLNRENVEQLVAFLQSWLGRSIAIVGRKERYPPVS